MFSIDYKITSAVIGLLLASMILWLIRRDHLHSRHAVWWLWMAVMIMVVGIFPEIIDFIAAILGVSYSPTLLLVFGFAALLLKVISIDIHQSALERKIRRLTQRLAILENEKLETLNERQVEEE